MSPPKCRLAKNFVQQRDNSGLHDGQAEVMRQIKSVGDVTQILGDLGCENILQTAELS
jgi:hypothetical protein